MASVNCAFHLALLPFSPRAPSTYAVGTSFVRPEQPSLPGRANAFDFFVRAVCDRHQMDGSHALAFTVGRRPGTRAHSPRNQLATSRTDGGVGRGAVLPPLLILVKQSLCAGGPFTVHALALVRPPQVR